jgi:hypothetical protein
MSPTGTIFTQLPPLLCQLTGAESPDRSVNW